METSLPLFIKVPAVFEDWFLAAQSLLGEVQGSQTLNCAHLRGKMLMCLFSDISQQSPLQLKYRRIQSE